MENVMTQKEAVSALIGRELACRSARKRNLQPHGIQKSFGGKAMVTEVNGFPALESYGTIVALIDDGELIRTWGGYSATTLRHVNAFMEENDAVAYSWDKKNNRWGTQISAVSKASWEDMPVRDAYNYEGFLPFN